MRFLMLIVNLIGVYIGALIVCGSFENMRIINHIICFSIAIINTLIFNCKDK